ncbi:DUF4184 family protein [Microbacterium sp.]|uniref:DUF4184 family protein n=1 Tax=Microbacterium sp. TaxID=51671 RepID=UPI00281225A0|nr:DUF4184 family protein [Microbacterium sp.]
MPFTPSHAVIALPFIRTPLVPAAIAIGAMTPDLPLFLRGIGIGYAFTHTVGNVVWTTLVAFALFLLWRAVLRPAVPELLPATLARKLPRDWSDARTTALRRAVGVGEQRWFLALLAASLMLGVLSHIGWDMFTHEGRGGVQLIPALEAMWGPLPGYKWLQHGSSVVGLAIIAVWAWAWLGGRAAGEPLTRTLPSWARIAWWASLPVVLVGALVLGLALHGPVDAEFTVQHLAYRMLPPACAIWGALTLLLAAALPLMRSSHQRG